MKSLNAKRITAIAAGAALLGLGLAFAGPVTFQNVPIISNSGQPVVQIVVGSTAQPSDGVAAANIAAAIGNLAFTSVPVTATVNATQAASVLKVVVTGSATGLTNAQVWLNESGSTSVKGGYSVSTLIGSVLNRAILLAVPGYTKSLQGTGQYAYPSSGSTLSLTSSPASSPYTGISIPTNSTPTYNTNGGGVSFTTFTSSGNDNILAITNQQFSGLASSWGTARESETLWLTGFPVFNQQANNNAGTFAWLSAGGAYQAVFGNPIPLRTNNNAVNQATIELLGQNWTILGGTIPSTQVTTTTAVNGGKLNLAQSQTPQTTVYVGQYLNTTNGFSVQLTDLGQPTSNGVSPASISVFYKNALTNTSQIIPGTTTKFNITGHTLFVNVNQTFAGLYAYQKWAKMQIYSNVYNLTDGQVFNNTYDKGWNVRLFWTNGTSTGKANELYSIVIYNTSPVTLVPGQGFTFIQNPAAYTATFVGETLSPASFDPLTFTTSAQSAGTPYQNYGGASGGAPSILNVTEPEQLLTVTSQIPNAFQGAGQSGSSVQYLLTPYQLAGTNNAMNYNSAAFTAGSYVGSNVVLTYTNVNPGNWINATYPLTVSIKGYQVSGAAAVSSSATTQTVQFQLGSAAATTNTVTLATTFYNITAIQVNRVVPIGAGAFTVNVVPVTAGNFVSNTIALATLSELAPSIIYTSPSKSYQLLSATSGNSVLYSNGGTPTTFLIGTVSPSGTGQSQYFTYTMNEIAVSSPSQYYDQIAFGIHNSTGGVQANPLFNVNYSITGSGTRNNVTYTNVGLSTGGATKSFDVRPGFRTERGSKVASIGSTSLVINVADQIDQLSFAVAPASSKVVTRGYSSYGPYTVGQSTNIPNVTIGKVSGNAAVSAGNYSITGYSSVQATPSVSQATTPVLLTNLSTTAPIAVLDSQANPSSNLILVGSGFVNTLSQQLQNSYNIAVTPTTQLEQAYGTNRILIAGYYANQTTAAANQFIQALYAQASK